MIKKCPLCNFDTKVVFTKYDWGDRFDFLQCNSCNHVVVDPIPSIEKLNSFYNKEYYVPDFQKNKVRKKGEVAIQHIDTKDANFLEIGSSYGYFLEFMHENGYKVDGFELSDVASDVARKKGFHIVQGNIENASLTKNYDCIFMFDVLEHIRNPEEFLNSIKRLLSANGKLIMTVPNRDSLEFRMCGKYWEWSSPPAHLHYFGFKSIKQLFEKNGFCVDELFSIKGDTAGNLFFHFFDSFKRMALFKIGALLYGRKKFLEKKMTYNLEKKSDRQFQSKEFSGLIGLAHSFLSIFNIFDRLVRNNSNEPTLFIKVSKNVKS